MQKKIKILVIIILLTIIIPLSIIIYPVIKNNNYEKELLNTIYNNTDIKDIEYLNKDNNYYIIKTKEKVMVLDLNYEEVLSLDIKELYQSNLELVYRKDNLYYIDKTLEEDKIIYKYYDVKTNEEINITTLGGV